MLSWQHCTSPFLQLRVGTNYGSGKPRFEKHSQASHTFFSVAHVIVRLGAESSHNACEEAVKKAFPLYLGHGSNRKYALG